MIDIIAQAGEISNEWVKYIIGGMAAAVVALAYFAKWMFKTVLDKTEKGLTDTWVNIQGMHGSAMAELKSINERGIINTSTLEEIKTDNKETKYSIQTLNTQVRCKKEDSEEVVNG